MYKVVFEKRAEKEFLKLDAQAQKLIAKKLLELQNGNFQGDKSLKGKYQGKFRKRAGNYRIIYYTEEDILLIIRVARTKEAY